MRHFSDYIYVLPKKIVFLLFFFYSISALSSEQILCKFAVDKANGLVKELETGEVFRLMLGAQNLQNHPATKQCGNTCYVEQSYAVREDLLQNYSNGQYSIDRVHNTIQVYLDMIQNYFVHEATYVYMSDKDKVEKEAFVFSELATYLKRKVMRAGKPASSKRFQSLEQSYDILSGGHEGLGARVTNVEKDTSPLSSTPDKLFEFTVKTLPKKTAADIIFENEMIRELNMTITKAMKHHYDMSLEKAFGDIQTAKAMLLARKEIYKNNSPIYQAISHNVQAKWVDRQRVFSESLDRLLFDSLRISEAQEKEDSSIEFEHWYRLGFRLSNEHSRREALRGDPWVEDLIRLFKPVHQFILEFDTNIREKALRVVNNYGGRVSTKAHEYWSQRIKDLGHPAEMYGLGVLNADYRDFFPDRRQSFLRKPGERGDEELLIQIIADKLESGSTVAIHYEHLFDHIWKEAESEFYVLDKKNEGHQKLPNPLTGAPYVSGGPHAELIVDVLKNNTTGEVTHFVLKGSHGREGAWTGKYLMSVEYFAKHFKRIDMYDFTNFKPLD